MPNRRLPRPGRAAGRPLVVIIRGPIGAGKSTLRRALAGKPPWRLYPLDHDAISSHHPSDPSGEWLDQEWDTEIDLLGLHAKLILGRGLNLVAEGGSLLSSKNVDRFLRHTGRSRKDPRVVLVRLDVRIPEAVRRKSGLKPSYVRASHQGWVTRPIRGEVVIDTSGKTAGHVARVARKALRERSAERW
jgi:shikimate kinase